MTGATKGIGKAIALNFMKCGARVIGTGTGSTAPSTRICTEYLQADFNQIEGIKECAQTVLQLKPDILINNAGINKISSFAEVTLEDFQLIQRVNLTAPFALCQAVLPSMERKGWGRIVNVSSIWGKISRQFRASYSASKFGLDGMTLALALEYAPFGVLANCVAPGFTDTEMTRSVLSELQINELKTSVPIGRMANVDEIARFIVWLASPENSYITGQNITIDGGFSRA